MGVSQYLCLDQKSFYATVECVERGLDPMTTNLVVADPERSVNTICLAVLPSLKAQGIRNRCRIKDIPPNISYITAPPRMQLYIDCAAEIYGVFLRYVAPQDIHDAAKQVRGKALQEAMLDIRARFGKNAILRGMNYAPAATGRERNNQIGGHKSGI